MTLFLLLMIMISFILRLAKFCSQTPLVQVLHNNCQRCALGVMEDLGERGIEQSIEQGLSVC